MNSGSIHVCRLIALGLLLFSAAPASPQESMRAPAQESTDRNVVYEGWYVVRAGDTLEGITQRYLGDFQRWQENWRLNPDLKNPHNLAPGQRLRILLRSIPDEGAMLTKKSNRVEDKLPPLEWQEARVSDVLRPRDSVRTFEASSAELTFGDDTRLTVSEESLVFLDRETSAGAASVTRDQIEIVVGQADLGGRGVGSGGESIELVIGDAVAVPEPSSAGQVQARARKAEAGAQLMAYEGGSKLAAAGVEIEVPQGMGSAVAVGAPPGPPEKLLPAPGLVAPADGARLMTPRPEIAWQVVEGASGYVVEVCRDQDCAQLVARAAADAGNVERWRPETTLPVADLFWRVTAVSPSGLDGYPSGTRAVTVTSGSEDETAPEQGFEVEGEHLPPRVGMNKTWILGPGASLRAAADDSQSGVDHIEYTLDGEPSTADAWSGPWAPGRHEATFTAIDGAGNRAATEIVPFVYDTSPPALSWGVEDVGFLAKVETRAETDPMQPVVDPEAPWTRRAKREIEVDDPHSFWPWRKQIWTVRHDGHQVLVTPSRPVLVTISEAVDAAAEDLTVVLGPGRGLWVLAKDEACGPSLFLDYEFDVGAERTRGFGKRGVLTLRLGAEDGVTNAAGATLHLTTAKADREARAKLEAGGE